MSSSEPPKMLPSQELSREVNHVYDLTQQVLYKGVIDEVADETVQRLLTAAVKLYVAKRRGDSTLAPFASESVTATEVAVTTTGMLDAVHLELFELSLWEAWGQV